MESIQMSDKDKVIFSSKADQEIPSKYEVPPPLPNEQPRGVVLPNGDINWTCPCLGGLPYGPCAFEFREFFSCLHRSQDEENQDAVKTEECFPKFAAMKECFSNFPKLYPPEKEDEDLEDIDGPEPIAAKNDDGAKTMDEITTKLD